MRITIFILLSLIINAMPSPAQTPGVAWQRLLSGNEGDYSTKVIGTRDNGSLVVGYTEAGGRDFHGYLGISFTGDILVIKFRADGTIEWQRCLGGMGSDYGASAIETNDGFLISGSTLSNECRLPTPKAGVDLYLAKLSKSGDFIWDKRYGGEKHDYGNAMAVDTDGNIYLGGYSASTRGDLTSNNGGEDSWVIKTSPTGNMIWQKSFGGRDDDRVNSICVTNSGMVIVAGNTQRLSGDLDNPQINSDAILANLTAASGDITWIRTYGGTEIDVFSTIIQMPDNSFLAGGRSSSKNGDLSGLDTYAVGLDAWLVNINAEGDINWQKIFAGEHNDLIQELRPAGVSGVVGIGYRSIQPDAPCSNGMEGATWIFKLTNEGGLVWEKKIASIQNIHFGSVDICEDRSIVVATTANTSDIPGYFGKKSIPNGTIGDIWAFRLHADSEPDFFPPSFEIEKSTAAVCEGRIATITTKTFNTGTRPRYRWKRNGMELPGINSTTLTASDFKNGEVISCTISSDDNCETRPFSISDQAIISHKSSVQPIVSISSSSEYICGCTEIRFSASRVNGGSKSSFQWRKNGRPVGYDLPEFITRDLSDGDIITCDYSDKDACVSGADFIVSNAIQIKDSGTLQHASINVVALPERPCIGSAVTLIAVGTNTGVNPIYEWRKNKELLVFSNDTIVLDNIKGSDVITCTLIPDAATVCVLPGPVSSEEIKIRFTSGLSPAIRLETISDTICENSTVTVRAIAENGGAAPRFQWFLNGKSIGTNSDSVILAVVNDQDIVSCRIYPDKSQSCLLKDSVDASPKIFYVRKKLQATASIEQTKNNVCQGEALVLTAVYSNTGVNPVINWYVNDQKQGDHAATFSYAQPNQGDLIRFILIPDPLSCNNAELSSDVVTATVNDTIEVTISPGDTTIKPGHVVHFQATLSTPVNSFSWTPATKLVFANTLDPTTVVLDDNTNFRLDVLNSNGCRSVAYATIKLAFSFYMPNAFTPNGDGLNDIYRIPEKSGAGVKQFSIYNRWGQLIFRTNDALTGWDGKIRGLPASAGAYIYIITGENANGPIHYKGSFVLIR